MLKIAQRTARLFRRRMPSAGPAPLAWCAVGLSAVFVLWSRLSGTTAGPTPTSVGWTVTVAALGLCLWTALCCLGRPDAGSGFRRILAVSGALVPALLTGLALLPGTPTGGIIGLLFLLVSAGVAIAVADSRFRTNETREPTAEGFASRPDADEAEGPSGGAEDAVPFRTHPAERTVQWFRRTQRADGAEQVEGVLEVRFRPGQRQAAVHVPFSPPLTGSPEVSCEILDGTAVRAKVAANHPFGLRIETRRSGAIDVPAEIQIGLTARTAIRSRAA